MNSMFHDIQPAVKKRNKKSGRNYSNRYSGDVDCICCTPHRNAGKALFDYTVILGGICGSLVAVLNFFLMGLTVQKVAAAEDEAAARMKMKASYSQRMLFRCSG